MMECWYSLLSVDHRELLIEVDLAFVMQAVRDFDIVGDVQNVSNKVGDNLIVELQG